MTSTTDRPRLAIIGAGIMGRLLAYQLAPAYQLTVYEQSPDLGVGEPQDAGASFAAGGMLAPYSELETFDDQLLNLSLASLKLWRDMAGHKDLGDLIGFPGTVIVHHKGDGNLLSHLAAKWSRFGCQDAYQKLATAKDKLPWASHLSGEALFVAAEGVVDNVRLLRRLKELSPSVPFRFGHKVIHVANATGMTGASVEVAPDDGAAYSDGPFAAIIDARGIEAKGQLRKLRGVRGEAIVVKARADERLKGPWQDQPVVRLLHPRYPIYVIPRPERQFIIGASTIESEDAGPITVRSLLELLSAAFSVYPALAEAQVVATRTGVRAAFDDNLPQVALCGSVIAINGLYRHGFLLAPILAEAVKASLGPLVGPGQQLATTTRGHDEVTAAICTEDSRDCHY